MVPLRDGTFPVPTGMHISGGPTWFAKADSGLTVHRGERGVEVHNWKARHKWIGRVGMTYLDYHVPTGRYSDYPSGLGPEINMPMRGGPKKDFFKDEDF
jgi:hypothetical protein